MTRKTDLFEGWSWFKFNNLGLALGTNLTFYTSVAKGFKLKVRKFWCLISTFVEITGEKLVGAFPPPPSTWTGLKPEFAQTPKLNKIMVWHIPLRLKDLCCHFLRCWKTKQNHIYYFPVLLFSVPFVRWQYKILPSPLQKWKNNSKIFSTVCLQPFWS